jgi:hypothetical protein
MDCPIQQALTRPKFDTYHQLDDMRITSYQLRYMLNPPEASCPSVYPVEPTTRLQGIGASWVSGQWRTDVESDLRGINRLGSRVRDEKTMYNPEVNKFNNIPLEHGRNATNPQVPNRVVNPPSTGRASGVNRWDSLFHDPQAHYEQPFDFFIPSKLLDKERCATTPKSTIPTSR